MKVKDGVQLQDLKIDMRPVLINAEKIWKSHGQELVITCTGGGIHSAGSLHYYGYAVDLRTRYFSADQVKLISIELANALGANFDVVVETTHIHVEYDPKNKGA